MIKIINSKDCCGCQACSQACSKSCISFIEKKDGFFYPVVDEKECVNCNICEKVCPIIQEVQSQKNGSKAHFTSFAAITNDDESLSKSSSGGLFLEISKSIIIDGGYVVGCIFDEDFNARHVLSNDINVVKKMRGSKYVQSITSHIYREVRAHLKENHKVLFSGTPCQCAAIYHFIRNQSLHENLILVDFACHGVPSPIAWNIYLKSLKWDKITNISMRDKQVSWERYSFVIEGNKNGKNVLSKGIIKNNIWIRGFLSHIYNRPSCYDCKFRDGHNLSDMTISDCWGAKSIVKDITDKQCQNGVSSVILRTEKGKNLFDDIKDNLWMRQIEYKDILKTNPALEHNHKAAFGTHFFFPLMHLNIPFKYSVLVCCAIGKILRILKISQ